MFLYFADDPDMENGMIDSSIVRAHPCAAGAQKRGRTSLKAMSRWVTAVRALGGESGVVNLYNFKGVR
jgi:hypothetical protein